MTLRSLEYVKITAVSEHPDFLIRTANWAYDQRNVRAIREQVFITELGIPAALEWDGRDADASHVIAETRQGTAVGTARLLPDGQIGRMAVLPTYRGAGIGRRMLLRVLELARQRGFGEVFLHAQVTAIPFYRRCGFCTSGDVFQEAGIAHQTMRLTVQ